MGGRETFASGNNVPYRYETVGKINGVKVLKGKGKNHNLPQEAHSSKAYIAVYPNGAFKQYREFNADRTVKFDIDNHPKPSISGNRDSVFHIHFYSNGIRNKKGRPLTDAEYKKYMKYFGGKK